MEISEGVIRYSIKLNNNNNYNNYYYCFTLFCTFLCLRCTTTVWVVVLWVVGLRFLGRRFLDTQKPPSFAFYGGRERKCKVTISYFELR